MKRFIVFLFFVQATLLSFENDPYQLAAFGGEPSSIIEGCVSAISGDYFFIEDALVVKGYEPIHLQSRYISREGERTDAGWSLFDHHLVAYLRVDKSPLGKMYQLELRDKSGVTLIYNDNLSSRSKEKRHYFQLLGSIGGLTNCSRGEIGARLNLVNNVVYRDPKDLKQIIVKGADGSERCYRCKESLKFEQYEKNNKYKGKIVPFYLSSEILPNGNHIQYERAEIHGKWVLKSITTKSSDQKQVFAWVKFDYNYPDRNHFFGITARTSDNQVLHYTFDPHEKNHKTRFSLLKNVLNPVKPNESYEYWRGDKVGMYLCERNLPDGRRLAIDYNRDRKNPSNYKKVGALWRPIGNGPDLHRATQIHYAPGKYNECGGHTNAFDAEGNLTQYQYDKNFMLYSKKRFEGSGQEFSEELFHWHGAYSDKPNWIHGKTLLSSEGSPLFAYLYHYDDKGNVIQEDLWGDLRGQGKKLIRNGNDFPDVSNAEGYFVKRAFYSNNLLYRETFPNGLMKEYHYHNGTDRLYEKLTCVGNNIKKREFFLYDGSLLVEEIIDDGSSGDINSLQDVSQRLIKKITPRRSQPFYGFPEVIEEKYYNLKTRQEVLLRKQEITYNSKGLVSQIVHYDSKGRKRYDLTYAYDGKGRLISQTDPLGRTRTIQHDENDNPLIDDDPNEAFAVHCRFDFSNRPTERIKVANTGEQKRVQSHYNFLNQMKEQSDEQGNWTHYEYNPFGHVTKIKGPPVFDENGSESKPVVQREYNALGQVSSEIDPERNQTKYFYTSRGKPYRVIHPDGSEEFFTYTLEGEIQAHISPEGVETHFTYDYQNRVTSKKIIKGEVLSEEKYIYNAFHLIEKVDPDGVSTYFSYDGAGRKIKEDVAGRVTFFSYDSLGRLVKVKKVIDNENAQVVLKTYDLLDRVIQELELDGKGNLFAFTHYSYDEFSNNALVKKEVQIGNALHFFEYDSFRRLVREINPIGDETTIKYNDHFKDKNGQTVIRKTTVDPKGRRTVETLNAQGSISTFEKLNQEGKLLLRENYYYDLNGKKIKQISELFDPDKKIVKSWKYDLLGRLIELNESDEKITRYSYTLDGHLKEIIKPDGVVISYEYDGLGRQTSIKTSDGSCYYSLCYDKMGNVIESFDHKTKQKTKRIYNHFGDLLEETLGNHFQLKRTYDSLSRCVELELPDASKVEYVYDTYHLKNVKRFDSHGVECYEHTYDEYDHSHNLIREFHPGSLGPVFHQVDLMGRRIRTDDFYSSEQIVEMDPNGNVLKYVRNLSEEDELVEYAYDDLDQLISETGGFEHLYRYDSHHNRLQKDGSHYSVDSLHQLECSSEATYEHDPNGNRIATHHNAHETFYSYDGLDRLTQIRSGNKAVNYCYDSWGRCLSRTYFALQDGEWHPTCTENFLYDGQNELGVFPHKIRILGQGRGAEIGATVAIETSDDFFVPFHDLYGNIIAVLNWDGECIESYRFSAYGEEKIFNEDINLTNSFVNPWRFQSKRKTGGLVNFGRRFYDPETGRWLSPDPKGFSEGPNLYQFSRNNPLIYFDLYGLSVESGARYSAKQFVKDAGYVYFYTWRRTLEGYATGNLEMMNAPANLGKALGNVVSGNRERPVLSRSQLYVLEGKKHPDVDFYFANGILNDKNDAVSAGKYIQKQLNGYEVKVMHNNTHGLLDLVDFAFEKLGFSTGVCHTFHDELKNTLNAGKKAEVQAHSEAHAISKNAFKRLSPDERNRIGFYGYSSVDILDNKMVGTVQNSLSGNDLVAFFANPVNCIGSAMLKDKHVEFLKPKSLNPITEHRFMSPVNLERVNDINDKLKIQYNLN